MNIVVSTHVQEAPQPESDDAIEQRLEEIAARKARLIDSVKHLTTRIQAMFVDLNDYNKNVQRSIAEAMREIHLLEEEMRARAALAAADQPPFQRDDLDDEFEEFDSFFSNSTGSSERHEAPQQDAVAEDPKLVDMFRKIAAKTHPDKTDDPALHMLFISAKVCRDNNDMPGMTEIYNYITGKASKIVSQLLQRLRDEMAEFFMLEQQFTNLKHSQDYVLLSLYEQDKMTVRSMSNQQMMSKYASVAAHLLLLRRQLGLDVQQP